MHDAGQLMIIYPDGRVGKLEEGTLVSVQTGPIKLSRGRWFLRPEGYDKVSFNKRATAMTKDEGWQQSIYGTVILDRRGEVKEEVVDV